MPQLIITDTKGKTVELNADTGISAMVAIRDAGDGGAAGPLRRDVLLRHLPCSC